MSDELRERAGYLATRLIPEAEERASFAERLTGDPGWFAQAALADLFASPARNIMVFFSDLLGLRQVYNRPGVVSDENWSLRLPRDYQQDYQERAARLEALNLPLALCLALRAGGAGRPADHSELIRRLETEAKRVGGAPWRSERTPAVPAVSQ